MCNSWDYIKEWNKKFQRLNKESSEKKARTYLLWVRIHVPSWQLEFVLKRQTQNYLFSCLFCSSLKWKLLYFTWLSVSISYYYNFLLIFIGGSAIRICLQCRRLAGDVGLISGSGRSPGKGNSNSLQYSCLKNPMDRGAWQTIVHGVARVRHNWAKNNNFSCAPGILFWTNEVC